MVYVAHDGMTALHTLRTQKPQIMLLDLMMPGMDGFEVCRRIRQFSDIPIIFLSAKDDETDRLVGLNMGGDDYVTKLSTSRKSLPASTACCGGPAAKCCSRRRRILYGT